MHHTRRGLLRVLGVSALLATAGVAGAATKVACVGDSITASSSRYPTYLAQGLGSGYTVRNFGHSGTTMLKATGASYWKTAQFTDSSAWGPKIVVIMLGTNDSKKIYWGDHGKEYKGDYLAMVRHYQGLPSHPKVFVMTSPPNYTDGSRYQPAVIKNQIVPTVHQVSKETGAVLIDIFTPLSGHPELFPDGTHPDTTGSKRIAAVVAKAIRSH
jgi:acyl-CoA thioesterase-1